MFKDEDLQSESGDEGYEDYGMDSFLKKMEKKYSKNPNKPKERFQALVDYGYGYNQDDSFIDDSEAYDQYVPFAITTEEGGFYMNSGVLEFRDASDNEAEVEQPKPTQKRKQTDGKEQKKKKKMKYDGEEPTDVPIIPLCPAFVAGDLLLGPDDPVLIVHGAPGTDADLTAQLVTEPTTQVCLPEGLPQELQENISDLLLRRIDVFSSP
ncbi:ubinuclein-1 [Thalassophryne amazonica]|uniref:ubinuclein-1 n=1 Tax=Thalassophryne amazonica TaxID=390379 RepID=UPI001470F8C7|nr:ubinuclein-1 [Thalassophryne amazonica]